MTPYDGPLIALEDGARPASPQGIPPLVPYAGPIRPMNAPGTEAAPGRSWLNNAGRGALARVFDLAGGVPQALGGLISTIAPETGADIAGFGSEIAAEDFGYVPRSTWEQVEQARGVLPTLGAALPFILEQGITSAPEIGAALSGPLGLATAVAGHTGRIAAERARNDGRAVPGLADVLVSAPAAGLGVVTDRLAGRAALPGMAGMPARLAGGGIAPTAGRVATAGGVGAAGGGLQEGGEYAATNLGTEAGATWDDTARSMLAGAVAGGSLGAGVRAVGESVTAAAQAFHPYDGPIVQQAPAPGTALPAAPAAVPSRQRAAAQTGGIQRVLPEENLLRGRGAARRVLETGEDLPGAMYREDVGDISFLLGTAGNGNRNFRGGFGLRHIAAKRSAVDGVDGDAWVRERLPEILARGHLHRLYGPPNGRRADIVLGHDQVTLSLMRDGRRETWVLTGYERWDPSRWNRRP